MSQRNQTLGEFIIENQSSFKYTSGELSRLINSIRLAAKVVNHEVNKAGLVSCRFCQVKENKQNACLFLTPNISISPAYVRDVFNRCEENKANFRKAK